MPNHIVKGGPKENLLGLTGVIKDVHWNCWETFDGSLRERDRKREVGEEGDVSVYGRAD